MSTPSMPEWEREILAPAVSDPTRDKAVSIARTVVPILWGALLTFLATRLPVVHDFVMMQQTILLPPVEAVLTGAWYIVLRWLEDHLPAWLTRLLMGANTQPVYVVPGEVEVPVD